MAEPSEAVAPQSAAAAPAAKETAAAPNCPFYGYHGTLFVGPKEAPHGPRLMLIRSGGNQCGLVVTSYALCEMFLKGKVPEWRECPVLRAATIDYVGAR